MNRIRRTFMRSFVAATVALAFAAAPAWAAAPSVTARMPACVLEPGVYGITDSTGKIVGILIIYPDCRVEVFTRPEIT